MKPMPYCSTASREDRFKVTCAPGSTTYSPRLLGPVAQGTYANLPTLPEDRIDLSTKGRKTVTNVLFESISEALTDLVGSRAREAIYDYMDREHSVGRNEIPEHLDSLFTLFEDTFGVGGKRVIGRIIAKKVYSKLDWEFESLPNLEFADYMERIKTKIASEILEQAR
jgi:hypothetical protein